VDSRRGFAAVRQKELKEVADKNLPRGRLSWRRNKKRTE